MGQEWKTVRQIPHWTFPVPPSRIKFVVGIFSIYQISSVSAYFLLLVNYSPEHYIEGSAIYSALWGTISCCFIIFFVVESVLQYFARSRHSQECHITQLFSDTK